MAEIPTNERCFHGQRKVSELLKMICKWGSAVTKSGVLLFCCHQTSCRQGEFVASWTWVVGALCVVELWWDGDVRADPAGFGSSIMHFCCSVSGWGPKFTFPNLWPAQVIFTWCSHLPLPSAESMFPLPVKVGERRQCFELKRNILINLQICK